MLPEEFLPMLKKAYEAGQQSVYCGCYDIKDCTSFEEWISTDNTDDLVKDEDH